jgi:hypothetical protein
VAYALVQDVAASWQQYQPLIATLIEPAPAGLVLHVAGPTDEGIRIIDIWEDEQAWQRFERHRLRPAIATLRDPAVAQPRVRELRSLQLVVGSLANPTAPIQLQTSTRPASSTARRGT